ncbi:MAG: hypothetical protein AAF650_04335 [Pseudomonadota bacterium]
MVNSGLPPDEARRIAVREIDVITDGPGSEPTLHIAVRGKRGVGYCKTLPGAVFPFDRRPSAIRWGLTILFFTAIERELDLNTDRVGNARASYSLRQTDIRLGLMEGADVNQIGENRRTSVETIEKDNAARIKNALDTGAINARALQRNACGQIEDGAWLGFFRLL